MTARELWRRLAFSRRRETLARQLSDEIQAHVELLARDYEHEGLPRDEALAAARRRIGNVGQIREESRSYWGFPAIEAIGQDVRYALRGLRKVPAFTAGVLVT